MSPSGSAPYPRASVLALSVVSALLHVAFILRSSFTVLSERYWVLFDDAMISMHFAANLARGDGLRWNPGEAPVEGYTNFLWTLVMSAVHLLPLPLSKTSLVVMLLSALILWANTAVVARIAWRASDGDRAVTLGAAVLTAFSFPLTYWALFGMEVGFIALGLNLCCLLVLDLPEKPTARALLALGALLSALVLTRTDLVVPSGVLVLAATARVAPAQRVRVFVALSLALVVTLGAHTALRVAYYHSALPNTFHLKATGVSALTRIRRGTKYLLWCGVVSWWSLAVPPLVWLKRHGLPRLSREPVAQTVALLAALVLGQVAYSVYVGGDAWEYLDMTNRYLSVTLGPLSVLAALSLSHLARAGEGALAAVLRSWCAVMALALLAHAVEAWHWPVLLGLTQGTPAQRRWLFALLAAALLFVLCALGLRPRALRSLAPSLAVPVACALLLLGADGWRWAFWVRDNLPGYESGIGNTRLGLLLHASTAPGVHFAEFSAGAVTYFARRPMIDILGKCDPVIARMPPAGPFLPGHNKWNFAYSVNTLRPEVVTRLWNATTNDPLQPWDRWGYDRLPNGVHVRRDAQGVDRARLGVRWEAPGALEAALAERPSVAVNGVALRDTQRLPGPPTTHTP